MDPSKGTVGFGSGLHGWAFNLKQFAEMYADKFKIDEEKMMKRLWGDQFYDKKAKKFIKNPEKGMIRGFVQYVMNPIKQVRYSGLFGLPTLVV